MIVGFTGSRHPLATEQYRALTALVRELAPIDAHHGDCVGADADFDQICEVVEVVRHAHPGVDDNGQSPFRAYCKTEWVTPVRPYLTRNRDIVNVCTVLVACPDGTERPRSGTWSTVRYARSVGREITIVWPDGTTTTEPAR